MSEYLTSHSYAEKLRALAQFLLSRPEFDIDKMEFYEPITIYNKQKFLAAIRALGNVDKEIVGTDLKIFPKHGIEGVRFVISAPRNEFCKKVQDEVWECEPLLSQEEEAEFKPITPVDPPPPNAEPLLEEPPF